MPRPNSASGRMQQLDAASAARRPPAANSLCPRVRRASMRLSAWSSLTVMPATLHSGAATGSRTFADAPDHGFASGGHADRGTLPPDRREHRDDPLLREDQDA